MSGTVGAEMESEEFHETFDVFCDVRVNDFAGIPKITAPAG